MINLKKLLALLSIFVLIINTPLVALASETSTANPTRGMNVRLNGEILINGKTIQAPATYIKGNEGEVIVPLRAVAEQLGITVNWNEADQSVGIGTDIRVFISKGYYIVGDAAPVTFSSPPEISDGFTYVPLSFIRDALTGYLAYVQDGSVIIENDMKNTSKLPVIEILENPFIYISSSGMVYNSSNYAISGIKGSIISPFDGISISAAEDQIVENLIQSGIQGDIKSGIKVSEITVEQTWEENKTQIFRADLLYRGFSFIAVFREGKLINIYIGGNFLAIYLADLNNDGRYEIIVNDMISAMTGNYIIRVFGIENLEEYKIDPLFEYDLLLAIDETGNNLNVYKGKITGVSDARMTLAGHLLLKDKQLVVQDDTGETVLSGESGHYVLRDDQYVIVDNTGE